jgi:hypothetical protein
MDLVHVIALQSTKGQGGSSTAIEGKTSIEMELLMENENGGCNHQHNDGCNPRTAGKSINLRI